MRFYNKVQNGFLKLANKKTKSYQIVNSNLDIKMNEKLILKKIDKLIFQINEIRTCKSNQIIFS